jgi:hypothetical protein
LPKEKENKIELYLEKFTNTKICKIRKFASFVGLLVSACPAVEYGWLYTKLFERVKYLNLKKSNDYENVMAIPNTLHSDFEWWKRSILNAKCKIKEDKYDLEIFSDAATTGRGALHAGIRQLAVFGA